MQVSFLDLRVMDEEREEILAAMRRMFDHGQFVMGEELFSFERQLSNYLGRRHAIGVSSGSDAVYIALRALQLRPGDEVITTCLSWIATANAIYRAGGTPVFADTGCDLNISVDSVARLVSDRTRAIVSVDFTGKLCDYEELMQIAESKGIYIVQDGSQAFGARKGKYFSGKTGILSAISHNPMKVFGALGEAGSILTDDDALAERCKVLRYNGTINKEYCIEPSLNGRMDSIQAAILQIRLRRFPLVLQRRLRHFQIYKEGLSENPHVILPRIEIDETHSLYTMTLLAEKRDALMKYLNDYGIETKIQHPILMCDQAPFLEFRRESARAAEQVKSIISVPIHEKLNDSQISYVVEKISSFYASLSA